MWMWCPVALLTGADGVLVIDGRTMSPENLKPGLKPALVAGAGALAALVIGVPTSVADLPIHAGLLVVGLVAGVVRPGAGGRVSLGR